MSRHAWPGMSGSLPLYPLNTIQYCLLQHPTTLHYPVQPLVPLYTIQYRQHSTTVHYAVPSIPNHCTLSRGLTLIKKKKKIQFCLRTSNQARHTISLSPAARESSVDNVLVRINLIIEMIRWTGLAPWEFEFPFPGCLISTFLSHLHILEGR